MQSLIESPATTSEFWATHHLRLKGVLAQDFCAQFRRVAETPLAHIIEGDNPLFRQALIFPLAHAYSGGDPITYAGIAPLLLIELTSGYLVAIQIRDCTSGRCPLHPLLSQLANYFEDIPVTPGKLSNLEGVSRRLFRRNIAKVDLEPLDFAFSFHRLCPTLDAKLAARIFGGITDVPTTAKREVMANIRLSLANDHEQTCTKFVSRLDPTLCSLVRARGQALSVSRYNEYCGHARTSATYLLQALNVIPLLNSLLDNNNFESKRLQQLIIDAQASQRQPTSRLRYIMNRHASLLRRKLSVFRQDSWSIHRQGLRVFG